MSVPIIDIASTADGSRGVNRIGEELTARAVSLGFSM